ncbi:hypothetical protein HC891_12190 [Candidatus Gracilibacteria bacterium]|nr:hypothetical protein [Candidatus Gracilibacteria bacterium]
MAITTIAPAAGTALRNPVPPTTLPQPGSVLFKRACRQEIPVPDIDIIEMDAGIAGKRVALIEHGQGDGVVTWAKVGVDQA